VQSGAGHDAVSVLSTPIRQHALAIAVGLALLLALTLAWLMLPVKEWSHSFIAWIQGLGVWGIAVFVVAYIVLVIVLAPGEIMAIAAGVIYGAWAFPLVIVAATMGAALAFLVSRYLVRDWVAALMQKRPLLQALDKAIEEEGWKTVLLLRLNPLVPFNLQNYFFGATDIRFRDYLVATFFGIMPASAAFVYLGTLGHAAAHAPASNGLKLVLLVAGLVATLAVIFIIGRRAKVALARFGVDGTAS